MPHTQCTCACVRINVPSAHALVSSLPQADGRRRQKITTSRRPWVSDAAHDSSNGPASRCDLAWVRECPLHRTATSARVPIITEDLRAAVADIAVLMRRVVDQVTTPTVAISAASQAIVSRAMATLAITVGGRLLIPGLDDFMPGTLEAFAWQGLAERAASRSLLPLLRRWVVAGANPPVHNMFLDIQPLASSDPVVVPVSGVAIFRGMPDLAIIKAAVQRPEEATPIPASAVVTVDWKTHDAFNVKSSIAAIGQVQALAFAYRSNFDRGLPIFLTDMCCGFRCWIVIAQ